MGEMWENQRWRQRGESVGVVGIGQISVDETELLSLDRPDAAAGQQQLQRRAETDFACQQHRVRWGEMAELDLRMGEA